MGSLASRQERTAEEVNAEPLNTYKYPPKSGNYFGTHFIMGGEKFETPQPEAYLFGDNSDLNFLGNKPAPCPYALPGPNEPSRTLKSLINIRKDSLRFVRAPPEGGAGANASANQSAPRFNIEFTFDTDVRCSISVHYFCTEEITRNGLIYRPRDGSLSSPSYRFKSGPAQTFSQAGHVFEPGRFTEDTLVYNPDTEVYPVVVVCQAEEGEEPRQCHVTTGSVDRSSDGGFVLKPLKQKQYIDGLVFLLQEIYGIENKLADNKSVDDDTEDSGAECVICMSDLRDTLILPCRHLCVCNCCADHLRFQASNCPICRAPFRALLQVRAVQKLPPGQQGIAETAEGIPVGYEPVSLVEALNGPLATPRDTSSPVTSGRGSVHSRPRSSVKRGASVTSEGSSSRDSLPPVSSASVPPEVRRKVLEERGRAEMAEVVEDVAAVSNRSRTPSREKVKMEQADESERRSLLESPDREVPAVKEPEPRAPQTADRSSDSEDSDERNSRLVTVIPIEHQTNMQVEDFQDTEDETIEDQCRPPSPVPPPSAGADRSAPGGHTAKQVDVMVVGSGSPASRSSCGSTRLLIPAAERDTQT